MSGNTVCPACGQPTIPSDLLLPPIKAKILELVRHRPGISAESLRTLVWADDPDGGPEDRKVLHVHVNQLNRHLRDYGLQVRGSRSFGYRLQSLHS
jgi:DNA-binding response OmpR family regulator